MKITKGIKKQPLCLIVYGPDGKGKSSLGSQFPKPLFLDIEKGSGFLDVLRNDEIDSFEELLKNLDYIITNGMPENCESLIVDSLDWAETLIHESIKAKYNVDSLEKAAGGFGKAYKEALEMHTKLKNKINLIRKKGVNVLLIAHSQIVNFNDPLTESSYDRYELKLHESKNVSSRAMWREFANGVFFVNNKVFTHGEGKNIRATQDDLFLFTKRTASFDAKSRVVMPEEIPFENEGMFEKLKSFFEKDDGLYKKTFEMAESLKDEEVRKSLLSKLPKYKNNNEKLNEIQKYIEGLK